VTIATIDACILCTLRINRRTKLFSGNKATLNFYLSNFTDVSSLVNAVQNIAYLGGNTNTTGGLRLARTEIFNAANGDRLDIPNVIILITDGIPTREVDELPAEVRRIKNSGDRIVGVGVTNAVSECDTIVFSCIYRRKPNVNLD